MNAAKIVVTGDKRSTVVQICIVALQKKGYTIFISQDGHSAFVEKLDTVTP